MLAYSYSRFSAARENKNAAQERKDSIHRQQEAFRLACEKHNWKAGDILADVAVSAFKGKNTQKGNLARFLQMLENGNIKTPCVLVVEDFDRISRQKQRNTYDLVRGILEKGCHIYTTMTNRLYTEHDFDKLISIMELAMRWELASEHSEKLSERITQWHERRIVKAKNGEILSKGNGKLKNVPFWLEVKDGKFKKITKLCNVIEDMFDMCINGMGFREITAKLNKDKVHIDLIRAGKWTASIVRTAIVERRVCGDLVTAKGEKISGYYPRVIDESVWLKAFDVIRLRTRKRGRPSKHFNLFTGLLRWKLYECGMTFVAGAGKPLLYTYTNGEKPKIAVHYNAFEQAFLMWLTDITSEDFQPKQANSKIAEYENEIAVYKQRIDELTEQLTEPGNPIAELVKAINKLKDSLKWAEEQLIAERSKQVRPELGKAQSVAAMLASATDEQQKELKQKLRSLLSLQIRSIELSDSEPTEDMPLADDPSKYKVYSVDVNLHNGEKRTFEYMVKKGNFVGMGADRKTNPDWLYKKLVMVFGAEQAEKIQKEIENG